MTDDNIAQLLELAARSYTPDTSIGLASAQARGARQRRVRRTTSIGLALLAVVSATVGLVLTIPGGNLANPARYLRISPTAQIVELSGPSNGLTDVYFANTTEGIGMEQDCSLSPTTNTTCSLTIVKTGDGGGTWIPVGHPLQVTYPDSRASYPFINFATNGKDGWIYGSKTFVTHNGGKTFEEGGPPGLVSNLSIVGNTTWALSRPCPPGTPGCSSTVYSTRTSGGPWRVGHGTPMLEYPYLQLLRTSQEAAFLAAQAADGRLYVTENGGVSWVSHPLPSLCAQLQHLAASSRHNVWALCSGATPTDTQTKALYHSVDAGSTWVLVATSNSGVESGAGRLPSSGIVTQLTSVGSDRLLIALDNGSLIESTDGGMTWAPQGLPANRGITQLTFIDARQGWVILSPNDTLYRTSDGGAHWTMAEHH
jgi:photosystem II stability/assembly factor-like uncharacterized protein